MADFVHLHLHTEFSLLDGACRVDEVLDEALKLKMPAVAVTEHGNMFSSVIFHDHARAKGIKPILGCEVYVAPQSRHVKGGSINGQYNHLLLLAETFEGWKNLIKLSSAGYTEGFYYRPRIDKELLARHATGLIGLSSCLKGEVAQELTAQQAKKALDAAATYRDILGRGNFFLEMQFQGIAEQKIVNEGLIPIARDLGMPLVATNDVHYLRQGDHVPHDILLCIGSGKTVNDAQRLRYHGDQFYMKTAEQMAEIFKDYPEAISNTLAIADRCDVRIPAGEYHQPVFEVPDGLSLDDYFEQVVREGFQARIPRLKQMQASGQLKHTIDEYEQRLSYEIAMIKKMGYAGYLLIVWDFIRYARENDIPVGPGRGSAAGSLAAWCMKITDVDPIDFDLIFERFLNPERVSMPDIDVDFCERRRGEVIEYVTRKYGRENVAQIITFGTMKAKAVVRDVGRALDMPYAEVDRVAKQIPPALEMTLDKALEENPALKQMESADPKIRELLAVGRRLEGMSRHASVHAAGVVIAPGPITDYAPLYKGARDEITTQWTMKEIERVGLLKMDFLGLSTLTLIRDALEEIKRTEGVDLDIDNIPLDDPKAYQIFCEGQTYGVFQFESSGMRELLRRARPQRLEDLIALNALYRPGPLKSGMVDDYVARKQGKTEVKYELPQLEPILSETYGVIAYQEQVMRIASALAGFSLGQADMLRKAMGKKDPKVMAKQREAFMAGAKANQISEKKASKIFELMEYFAGYGFNKSHSTAYAFLAYQTAYLKGNYPWHFAAALLTIEAANTDKLAMYLGECRDRGIPVLPPDINESQLHFTVEKGKGVRFGLTAIKGLGEGAVNNILAVRQELGGRIPSLHALCEHLDLRVANKRVFEALVKSGACDSLVAPDSATGMRQPPARLRARLFAQIDPAVEHGQRRQRDRDRGQSDLFGAGAGEGSETVTQAPLPDAEPWPEIQMLTFEKESLGLYWSGHPIDRYADDLKAAGAKTLADLLPRDAEGVDAEVVVAPPPAPKKDDNGGANWRDRRRGEEVMVGGMVSSLRPLKTKKGDRMCVFVLDDPHATIEVIVFPEAFARSGSLCENGNTVLVKGQFEKDDESARITATEIQPIEAVREKVTREVAIRVRMPADRGTFEALGEVFSRHRGDRRIALELEVPAEPKPLRVRADILGQIRVRPSSTLILELEQIVGQGAVSLR